MPLNETLKLHMFMLSDSTNLIYLTKNKLLFPSKIRKLTTGKLLSYNAIDPIQGVGKINQEQEVDLGKYRWWWRYLRLCLELEEQRIKLLGQDIRVDRAFYRKWNLDTLLSVQFEKWWQAHQKLFFEESVSVLTKGQLERLERGFSRDMDAEFVYLKVPKSLKAKVAFEQIKGHLKNRVRRTNKLFKPCGKTAPLIRYHIQYNCLVMSINGSSREKIMSWCNHHYQGVSGAIQNKKDRSGQKIDKVFSYEQSVSRTLTNARKNLLLVTRGFFS